ncbi:MAG: GspE/PulE family protein [Planctomycetota bacterium]|nr:GspE/PulE family protein [Planctomycetota bacterium]
MTIHKEIPRRPPAERSKEAPAGPASSPAPSQESAAPRATAAEVSAAARALGIPFVILQASMVKADAIKALPWEFLEKHNALPLAAVGGWLTVAVEDFADAFLREEIASASGMQAQILAAMPDNIRAVRGQLATERHRHQAGGLESSWGQMLDQIGLDVTVVERRPDEALDDLEAAASDSPVIKLVNFIICTGVQLRASDIHIEPDGETFRVRYRVDGELSEQIRPPTRLLPAVVSRIKIMANLDISERRLPQDGGITASIANRAVELRVSTMPTRHGEKVAVRIIDHHGGILGLDSIGFEPGLLARFRGLLREPNGLVLVTGPTGSGKSTTLYGALSEIANVRYNISTVEDPVECRLRGVNQFQVMPKSGFTFAGALRALLRQDPDVIMVGEVRDVETARLATEAALTGHLVLTTLHTNDAPGAIPRLINMGVEPYLVAAAVRGVLAQRLVRRICPHCRQEARIAPSHQAALAQLFGPQIPLDKCFAGRGCANCRNTGLSGRTGIHELMLLTEEMLSGLARDPHMTNVRELALKHGYTPLLMDGIEKVRKGLITLGSLLGSVVRVDDDAEAAQPPAGAGSSAGNSAGNAANPKT